jgi:CubicO group peptidase (beta-lactamase class C family)
MTSAVRVMRLPYLLAVAMLFALAHPTLAEQGAPISSSGADVEASIQRVVEGLRPLVAIAGEPSAKLADRMNDLHVPGVSIAVIHNGVIEWARGFGVVTPGGPPVTADTLFQAGSISKPVSAVAAIALVQAGKLDLDADVNLFLKSWKVPANSYTDEAKVTLRQLLSHSAGTTVLNGVSPANSDPIVVDHRPGARFHYSGGGYAIVQQMLIDVSGKPFANLLEETVLRPFGMIHSTFLQPLPATLVREAATPHLATGAPVPGGPHTYPEQAAAGLWTTPTDLARFALALLDAWSGRAAPVLWPSTVREMLTPGLGDYGLGLVVRGSPPYRRFAHDGVDAGFVSSLVAYETGDGAVVMTNGYQGGELANEIVNSIAAEYHWPDWPHLERKRAAIDPNLLNQFVGTYQLRPGFFLYISTEGGRLFSQATGQEKHEIIPQSDREFFFTVLDAVITFKADAGASPAQLTLHQNGADHIATRVQ